MDSHRYFIVKLYTHQIYLIMRMTLGRSPIYPAKFSEQRGRGTGHSDPVTHHGRWIDRASPWAAKQV